MGFSIAFLSPPIYNRINEINGLAAIASPRRFGKSVALVIELKYDKSAGGAIGQIKDRQYTQALEGYGGEILLVGVNYHKDGRNKRHSCVIEKMKI